MVVSADYSCSPRPLISRRTAGDRSSLERTLTMLSHFGAYRPFPRPRVRASFVISSVVSGLALLVAGFAWTPPSWAFAPQDPAPEADLVAAAGQILTTDQLAAADLARAQQPLTAFSSATGSRWNVLDWASSSLTPRLAVGTGLDLGGAISTQESAVRTARAFV